MLMFTMFMEGSDMTNELSRDDSKFFLETGRDFPASKPRKDKPYRGQINEARVGISMWFSCANVPKASRELWQRKNEFPPLFSF